MYSKNLLTEKTLLHFLEVDNDHLQGTNYLFLKGNYSE